MSSTAKERRSLIYGCCWCLTAGTRLGNASFQVGFVESCFTGTMVRLELVCLLRVFGAESGSLNPRPADFSTDIMLLDSALHSSPHPMVLPGIRQVLFRRCSLQTFVLNLGAPYPPYSD